MFSFTKNPFKQANNGTSSASRYRSKKALILVLFLVTASVTSGYIAYINTRNASQITQSKADYLTTLNVLPIAYYGIPQFSPPSGDSSKVNYINIVNNFNRNLIINLTEGTRRVNYVEHSLKYISNDIVFHDEAIPAVKAPAKTIDYTKLLNRENICNQVDKKGIREVWIYYIPDNRLKELSPITVFGNTTRKLITDTKYIGSDSNEYNKVDNVPHCDHTYSIFPYSLYNLHKQNTLTKNGELLQIQGTYLESLFKYVDNYGSKGKIWERFTTPQGKMDGTINGCGTPQTPPNTTKAGDYSNDTRVKSYCNSWIFNNNLKETEDISCHTWHTGSNFCPTDSEGENYLVWWMQRIPGYYNHVTYEGTDLRDWWDFVSDFDSAISRGLSLKVEILSPSGTITAANNPSRYINLYPSSQVKLKVDIQDKYDYLHTVKVLVEKSDGSDPKKWGCNSKSIFEEKWCTIDSIYLQDGLDAHFRSLDINDWTTPKTVGTYYISLYIQNTGTVFHNSKARPCIGDPISINSKVDWVRCDTGTKILDYYTLNVVNPSQKLTGKIVNSAVPSLREMYINYKDKINFKGTISNYTGTTTKGLLLLEKANQTDPKTWGCPASKVYETKWCNLGAITGKASQVNQDFILQGSFTFTVQGTYYATIIGTQANGDKSCMGDPLFTGYNSTTLRCDYSSSNNDYFVIHTAEK